MSSHRALRFCFVTTFYPPYNFGGDGIFVYRLAEALAERGHVIDVVHSVDAYRNHRSGEPPIPFTHHENVRVHSLETPLPTFSTLAVHQLGAPVVHTRALRELLSNASLDVIHFHNTSLMGAPAIFGFGDAVKLHTSHEYWLVCPTHVLFKFGREACVVKECVACQLRAGRPPQLWRHTGMMNAYAKHLDRFLMPSRFTRDRHIADGIEGNFTVLPHFVPRPIAEPTPARDPATDPYFLVVGRLEKLKGVQDLLPVFHGYKDARLVIVGSGDYEPTLRAAALGNPAIEFRGYVHPSEMGSLYQNAVAVLAPSLCYETFFLVGAEAMMHGTPVIARRIGALEEMVTDSGGGLLFDTPESLRDAMSRMQRDPALRAQLADRGRKAAEEKWTIEAHLAEYLGIVDELIATRAAGRA